MRSVPILVISLTFAPLLSACGDDDSPGAPDGGGEDGAQGGDGGRADASTMCMGDASPATCDYFLQCGCDMGQKCTASTTARMCGPAGTKTAGEACANDGECVAGTTCVLYGGATRCMLFCDDSHPCPMGDACYIRLHNGAIELGYLCGDVCSLRDQDCMFDGQGCYPASQYVPEMEKGICAATGAGMQGAACMTQGDCAEGFICADVDNPPGTSVCAAACDRMDSMPGCGMGTTCKQLQGHTATGVCLP